MCGCCGCGPTTPPATDRTLKAVGDTTDQPSIPTLGAAGAGGGATHNVMGTQVATGVALDAFKGVPVLSSFELPRVLTGLRRLTSVADNAASAAASNHAAPASGGAAGQTGSPSNSVGVAAAQTGSALSATAAKVVLYRPGILRTDKEVDANAQPSNGRQRERRLTAPPSSVAGKGANERALKTDRPVGRALTPSRLQVPKGPSPHSISSPSTGSGNAFNFSTGSSLASTANNTPKEASVITAGAHSAHNSVGEVSGLGTPSQVDHSVAVAAGVPKKHKPKKSKATGLDDLVVDADFFPEGQVDVTATALASSLNLHHRTLLANEDGGPPIPADKEIDLIYTVGSPKRAHKPSPIIKPVPEVSGMIPEMVLRLSIHGASGGVAAGAVKSGQTESAAGEAGGAAASPYPTG